ncbi:glycosyltransferase [Micromonospora sp. NPDC047730]|uniref:glycosyltransferase n=1 Tax=Micromonospora sp. NPDC047730 TaxID=3364253 RepID=UPI00371F4806
MGESTVRRRDWVAYVGPFQFPWGQPGSRRVFGIAGSLASAGYHVVVASGEESPRVVTMLEGVDGPGSVSYLGLGETTSAGGSLLARTVHFAVRLGRRTVDWLDTQPTPPSHVVVYGGAAQYMLHLRRWCRRHAVPLLADVVEWYDPRHLRGGFLGPLHLSSETAMRYFYPRCAGIIAISSYLEDYYRQLGTNVVRVPPTLDVRTLRVGPAAPRKRVDLSLVYSGTPGRKDLLGTMVRAVDRLERRGAAIELRVYGPTVTQVRDLAGLGRLPQGVDVRGRLAQQEVPLALRDADFSVILRRPERFAQAGFPTKFCESLANGTPVIANLTSDLGTYLRHGVEGLVCDGWSEAELATALHAALELTRTQREAMREAARVQALDSFDYRAYAPRLATLLESARP